MTKKIIESIPEHEKNKHENDYKQFGDHLTSNEEWYANHFKNNGLSSITNKNNLINLIRHMFDYDYHKKNNMDIPLNLLLTADNKTVLMISIENRLDDNKQQLMLSHCLEEGKLEHCDNNGNNALMYAILNDEPSIFHLIIRQATEALLKQTNNSGETPLLLAIKNHCYSFAVSIVKSKKFNKECLSICDKDGNNAIKLAERSNHTELLRYLKRAERRFKNTQPDMAADNQSGLRFFSQRASRKPIDATTEKVCRLTRGLFTFGGTG